MCQRYCDKKQLFTIEMMNTVRVKYFDNNYFTISCLAQHHVEASPQHDVELSMK